MKIAFIEKMYQPSTLTTITRADAIVQEYMAAGFRLTVRQLFYQFVSRGWIENTQRAYGRLAKIVNDARLTGDLDWDAIEDRGRNLHRLPTWTSPAEIIVGAYEQYRIDLWEGQGHQVEVWIEKEALLGVIAPVCERLRVPYFACKGYASSSEVWDAGYNRFATYEAKGRKPVVLHLGDHDPSGIDMTRDLSRRLCLFAGTDVLLERIALNWDQIEEHRPPPNPAKPTDARFQVYYERYGRECWELDALDPHVIADLIERYVLRYRNPDVWERALQREDADKKVLDGLHRQIFKSSPK